MIQALRIQTFGLTLCISLALTGPAQADVIEVPGTQPTIQAAIDTAFDGDTVLVAPGTYPESIDFLGKAVTVTSSDGPEVTTIDGSGESQVVRFTSGEQRDSLLTGFTLKNAGRGILIDDSSPAIIGNIIRDNQSDPLSGAGISIDIGSPLIQDNIITNNHSSLSDGGGIWVFLADAEIIRNVISNNSARKGGGIFLDVLDSAGTVYGNIIVSNVSTGTEFTSIGGGINVRRATGDITQNLIINNSAIKGGGVALDTPSTAVQIFTNNTIANNHADFGSAFYSDGFNDDSRLTGNVIIGSVGETAFHCGDLGFNTPVMEFNDVYSLSADAFSENCIDPTGTSGNVSIDPLFLDVPSGNFRPGADSPLIDAGSNSAPGLPGTDLDRRPRILDGDGDLVALADIGAYEFGDAPELRVFGACPGMIAAVVFDVTPEAPVALLSPADEGAFFLPGGSCAGMLLGLGQLSLMGLKTADVNGNVVFVRDIQAGSCGQFVQAADVTSCVPSNVAQLP